GGSWFWGIIVGLVLGRGGKPPAQPVAAKPGENPASKPAAKPVEKPVEHPVAKTPEEKPAEEKPSLPPKEATPAEKWMARFKDATEKRYTEEVMARTEELLRAVKIKDAKTIRAMMDEVAFGQLTDAQVLETFTRGGVERTLESWEFQDVDVRLKIP